MAFNSIDLKIARIKNPVNFTIYPYKTGDNKVLLQSSNYCIICFLSEDFKKVEKSMISPRRNQYPNFLYCQKSMGGKEYKNLTPENEKALIDKIVNKGGDGTAVITDGMFNNIT